MWGKQFFFERCELSKYMWCFISEIKNDKDELSVRLDNYFL